MKNLITLTILVISLVGCSESESQNERGSKEKTGSQKEHLLSDQQKMIQKAKDGEKLIKEADDKRRKALDDQGG